MKALSILQPHCWAICEGVKPEEFRSWTTDYRGPLLIHASSTYSTDEELWAEYHGQGCPEELPACGIVGMAQLVDIRRLADRDFAWVLKDPMHFKERLLCKGKLGLWDTTPAQDAELRRIIRRGPSAEPPPMTV